jgi:hypothetical protein
MDPDAAHVAIAAVVNLARESELRVRPAVARTSDSMNATMRRAATSAISRLKFIALQVYDPARRS